MIEGEDSDEDIVTEYTRMEEEIQVASETPPVPTISVTPHSPASITTGRQYSVLEDNLCQLRNIVEAVQQMKDANLGALSVINQPCARLSCSCPSLNDQVIDSDLLPGCVTAWSSTNTHSAANSTYRSQRNSGDWWNGVTSGSMIDGEMLRRRSWAALEDLTVHNKRQSISVSSAESDIDDPFLDSTTNLLKVTDGVTASITRRCKSSASDSRHNNVISNTSTHSLNEADLKSDFMKVRAKREAQERLLQARIPLQKSISTPSMLAVRELFCQPSHVPHASSSSVATSNNAPASVTDCLLMSETDEEAVGLSSHNMNYALLNHFLQQEEEGQKRRKRGSLFFRKRKDKNIKKTAGTHAWVASIASTAVTCDCCSKPIGNKQTLHCDNCFITVHRNGCSEQVADCCKSKSSKSHGSGVQVKANYAVKRGTSGPLIQPQYNSTFANAPADEKDDLYHRQELSFYGDDCNSMPLEFLDEAHISTADLDTDAFLGLQDDEPDTWTPNVTKDILRKLTDKEIKRQEHIYEFILTEKHHCLTLLVMQKIFVEGLEKYFKLGTNVQRMFPRLSQLTNIHLKFLHNLRERQKAKPVVDNIGDVLLRQFSDENAEQLKDAYGEFCSRHRDAVDIYKYYLQHDTRFAQFVKYSQSNPLLKKKGISECILFVTQRLTKYPLLIEPLIKTSRDNKTELETLSKALALVKEILVDVDSCVAEKEKEDRKLEIYNKLDAKSFAIYKDEKFKKSHILSNNRCLRFEGEAMLMQGRGKMQLVHVVVLSDVLFFLLENNNEKFIFFTPDNKTGVISLQKVLVREKAGTDCRGLYLISSNPCDPEMYELKIHKPKDKQVWIKCIREAVQNCPEEDEINNGQWASAEEREKQLEMKQIQIQEIVEVLRQKDVEQAMILEEKIRLQLRLLAAGGVGVDMQVPSYSNLVCQQLDNDTIRQQVINTVQKVNELTSSFYESSSNLSRSASSVGEHQSNTYVSPALPKRAETFGGFDNAILSPKGLAVGLGRKLSQQLSWKRGHAHDSQAITSSASNSPVSTPELSLRKYAPLKGEQDTKDEEGKPIPSLLQLEREQQSTTLQLTNLVYTLASIVAQQITSIDSLQAQLAVCNQELGRYAKDVISGKKDKKPMYRHNQQLEELRNLQDKLTQEKETWQREKESQERDLQEKRDNLLRLQEQIKKDQDDVTQQREQLYRKLEMFTNNSNSNSNNNSNPEIATPIQSDTIRKQSDSMRWKQASANKNPSPHLPVNLISTTNQQKVPCTVPIKQKLPLKLASKLATSTTGETISSGGTGSGGIQQLLPLKLRETNINSNNSNNTLEGRRSIGIYHKMASNTTGLTPSHSRTGSSPAMMQNTQELMSQTKEANKAERTNTYPKIPDKFKLQSGPEGKKKDNDGCDRTDEQEVIFF